MSKLFISVLAAALVFATPVFAGDDHDHSDGKKHAAENKNVEKTKADKAGHEHSGKHGGMIAESGHHHVELVAKDGSLELHVEGEDGKPEDIKDAKATAAVLADGKKEDITLTPDAGNFLKGTGTFKVSKGATVVVTLTMPDHQPEQARFKLE